MRMLAQAMRRRWLVCRRLRDDADWRTLQEDGARVLAAIRVRTHELELAAEHPGSVDEHRRVWKQIADAFWIARELEDMLRSIESAGNHG